MHKFVLTTAIANMLVIAVTVCAAEPAKKVSTQSTIKAPPLMHIRIRGPIAHNQAEMLSRSFERNNAGTLVTREHHPDGSVSFVVIRR